MERPLFFAPGFRTQWNVKLPSRKSWSDWTLKLFPKSEIGPRMEAEVQVRRATAEDAEWTVDLSSRVQESLAASGSLQEIGPLALNVVETSIRAGYAYILELKGQRLRIGCVLVPLDGASSNTQTIQHVSWGVKNLPGPLWYLQSLMIEPNEQGKGLGLMFLDGVLRLMKDDGGTIILDCWAGNTKLRDFYEKAGFMYHGNFPENDYEISVFFQTVGKSLPERYN
jgi:ribosomal protein S18 acetylase RimI-like enzyme